MSIKSEIRRYSLIGALFLSILFAISSCGGGGDGSSNPTPTASTISGTAATGNPIESAQVTVLDSTGATASGTTGTDGSFSISFSEPKPPYILKVTTSSGTTLYSVSADSETTTTINITPLTDMIIRLWYAVQNGSVEDSFTNPAANPPPAPTAVNVINSLVQFTVRGWLQRAGVDVGNFNLINTPFKADGTGVDQVLNLTTVDQSAYRITTTDTVNNITQTSNITASNGYLSVVSASTTSSGTSGAVTTGTVVPVNPTQAGAIDSINTTISNFINTINQKGTSLQAGDLAPYLDPGFKDNGLTASQWETVMATYIAGTTVSFIGFQINSLDTVNNAANVTFLISLSQDGQVLVQSFETVFKSINGSWLIAGNGNIADVLVMTEANAQNLNPKSTRFEVDDPNANNVQSVIVSGPGISGNLTVPMVCDSEHLNGLPFCGNAYGFATVRAFQIDVADWPTIPGTFTFTLTDVNDQLHVYSREINVAYGFDSSGNIVEADYPEMTLTSPADLHFQQILNGVTVHGTVFVPIWVTNLSDAPAYSYLGPDFINNDVTNQRILGTWDSGVAIPGQMNNFTIVIPQATINSNFSCSSGGGTCYNITFQGQTGDVQDHGRFGEDASCYISELNGSSCTSKGGIVIH